MPFEPSPFQIDTVNTPNQVHEPAGGGYQPVGKAVFGRCGDGWWQRAWGGGTVGRRGPMTNEWWFATRTRRKKQMQSSARRSAACRAVRTRNTRRRIQLR